MKHILSLKDFEAAARKRLPRPIFGYISGAAEEHSSLADNRQSMAELKFSTRVLRGVGNRDQSVELFGDKYASPFGIAPMGIASLSTYRGDMVLARAAQAQGIVSILSGASLIPMEDIARECPGTWFQAYLPGDQVRKDTLVARVARAGFKTLVVTVDIPTSANRENNIRTGFSMPLRPTPRLAWNGLSRPRWLLGTWTRTLLARGMPYFENMFAERGAPMLSASVLQDFTGRENLNWSHLERIRGQWRGHLVIKGILSVEDAVQARRIGADAIVLSNHGGRQLDGAIAPLRLLEPVVRAVGQNFPVIIDGGFRRGSDVLKAVALGARLVLLGRPFNYAAAVGGERGVLHAIGLLRDEVDRNMAMLGVTSCPQLDTGNIVRIAGNWQAYSASEPSPSTS